MFLIQEFSSLSGQAINSIVVICQEILQMMKQIMIFDPGVLLILDVQPSSIHPE
jgi:hypothetical protein